MSQHPVDQENLAQPDGEFSADAAGIAAGSLIVGPPVAISVPAHRIEGDASVIAAPDLPPSRAVRSRSSLVWRLIVLAALAGVVVWAYQGIGFDYGKMLSSLPVGREYLSELFPHTAADRAEELATLRAELGAVLQSLQIAIVGTLVGALLAFPVSFFAARTTSLFRPLSVALKTVLNVGRAVPVLIYAVFVVAFFGLGPPPGVVALTIGSFVMLAKLYAEGLESVAPGPVEAVRATGGNAVQTYVFGMLPQVFPNYLSATLYAFELNIAASAVLGLVGAGGLGYDLQNDLRLYKMLDVGAILLLLIVLVNIVDYLSYKVRQVFT